MADCSRCGGLGKHPYIHGESGDQIWLCGACDAEFREWIDQDGFMTPLWRDE